MKEYLIKISGVHYAANPEAENGMPDSEEMHARTREMLSWIDQERPRVVLSLEPSNRYNPDCIMAIAHGQRLGRVSEDSLPVAKSLMTESGRQMMITRVEEVNIVQHGYFVVSVKAEELTSIHPLKSSEILWDEWLKDDLPSLPPDRQKLAELEASCILDLLIPQIDEADFDELKDYITQWLTSSRHNLSREARLTRSLYIECLESAQRKEVRQLAEPLKKQRRSICGRSALIERSTKWWDGRLESAEMKRQWEYWRLTNNGELWKGLRAIDDKLRKLPGNLYFDIGKRDVVLSRLYYLNTPEKALETIVTLLMLRELACRQLGIDMKPMIESEYGTDGPSKAQEETSIVSNIWLNKAKGQKIELIRIINVMYEQGRFKGKDGEDVKKLDVFVTFGKALNVDLSNYQNDLSSSMSDSAKLEKHTKVFDDMKEKMIEIWNSR